MTTSSFGFSLASIYSGYLRRCFTYSGLVHQTIPIDDQTTISFWSPTSPTTKPPLILIHGFGPRALWQWRFQIKPLSSHFSLCIPDLVFFGDSTTYSKDRSEVFQAASVAKLLDKLGLKKYSILGTSYGGFVCYHLAKMCPDKVVKVVIASSAVNKTSSDDRELLKRANVEKIEDLLLPTKAVQLRNLLAFAVFKSPLPFRLPDFLLNDFLIALYSDNREQKKELLMFLNHEREDPVKLSPLQQEVLIVWGEHDQIFPLQKAFELKEILGENVRLEVMQNTSHVPQVEDPNQFNEIVMKFLLEPS